MNSSNRREGVFSARIIEETAEIGKNENTGSEQVVLDAKLSDGSTERIYLSFTDKASQYSIAKLKACGWDGGNSLAGIGKNEVQISIRYEMYNGKEQKKVDIMTGPKLEPMKVDEKSAFFTKLNTLAGNSAGFDY